MATNIILRGRRALRAGVARRAPAIAIIFLLACSSDSGLPTAAEQAENGPVEEAPVAAAMQSEPIPGQYIVTFVDSVSDVPGLAKRIAAQHGNAPLAMYSAVMKGFAGKIPDQAVEALRRDPSVQSVEQDQLVHVGDVQTSPASWGLDRIDQHTLPYDRSFTYDGRAGAGVHAYILDTGIRTTHQEFSGRTAAGVTMVADGKGTADCNGHGTHVAGIVGGTRYGVAKAVTLHPVRVLDCSGAGTNSAIIAGIDWVTQNRILPAVANMSMGGSKSVAVNAAIQSSIAAGVVYVVAAGNNAADACNYSPASTAEAITTGSSWNGDGMSGFSNFGACVDLFAPGEAIRAASHLDDSSSTLKSGTSMAAPHAAGVVALYLAANPGATPGQVASALVGGSTPNLLSAVPAGTPNRLLFSGVVTSGQTQPPADTTVVVTPPPPPPPAPSDQAPVASFTRSCSKARCTFDASGSTDDRGVTNYEWSFGDGSVAAVGSSLVTVSHTFPAASSYVVTLTVSDAAGQKSTKSMSVTIRRL